jgi:sugar lactone lactonase YvrE
MVGIGTALQDSPVVPDADALIREARRRQHRRWMTVGAVIVVGAVVATLLIGLHRHHAARPRPVVHATVPHHVARHVPQTFGPQPQTPGSLAIGPDGGLYIADYARDQILELRNGTFRVVAGDGKRGYRGDAGPAAQAEINGPFGMAFRGGTLYFADSGNNRIRAVSTSGIITTVAGNGRIGWVADGTPALAAALNPSAMTFGPDGRMYVTSDLEVLRLNSNDTFTRVIGNPKSPDAVCGSGVPAVDACPDGAEGLAFDGKGDLYVYGSDTKALLMVNPEGTFRILNEFGSILMAQVDW